MFREEVGGALSLVLLRETDWVGRGRNLFTCGSN